MSNFLERLKSPVVWGAFLTALYAQLELWQSTDITAKDILLGCLMIVVTVFAAINNPTDRDSM